MQERNGRTLTQAAGLPWQLKIAIATNGESRDVPTQRKKSSE